MHEVWVGAVKRHLVTSQGQYPARAASQVRVKAFISVASCLHLSYQPSIDALNYSTPAPRAT